MCDQDLALVLTWRNHPEVRRYMFSTHEIAIEEHRRWFDQAKQESARHLLIYEREDVPLGFVNLHVVNPVAGFADWGFYVTPEAPRGSGIFLGKAVARHVFGALGLYKLSGQVLKFNERSLRFHLRLGFKQEGVLREHYFDGTDYHDLVCFGLLKNEWTNSHG
jgi:UDP-4-amino-4,6-dideoxy-N-acetyl-beta-L-altrosamine N-acetyltransferase